MANFFANCIGSYSKSHLGSQVRRYGVLYYRVHRLQYIFLKKKVCFIFIYFVGCMHNIDIVCSTFLVYRKGKATVLFLLLKNTYALTKWLSLRNSRMYPLGLECLHGPNFVVYAIFLTASPVVIAILRMTLLFWISRYSK